MTNINTSLLPAANASDMAVVELRGQRFLLLGLGPSVAPAPAAEFQPLPTPAAPAQAPPKANSAHAISEPSSTKYVYGLKGIAQLFNCSKSTAYNIKHSGKIDAAISQIGNTIVVDAEMALQLSRK